MQNSIKNKVAIITGASKGIGKAIALELAAQGVNLALCGRDEGRIIALQEQLKEYNVRTIACVGDITNEAVLENIITSTVNEFGCVDILINNAGIADAKPIEESTAEDFDRHMSINVKAPFLLSRMAIPYLKNSTNGTIINISSVVGYKGYANQGIYAASKHALTGFTKVLAQEVQKDNIRVHLIAPGGVNTEMVTGTRPDLCTDDLIDPQELAEIIVFLLTHRNNAAIDEVNIRRCANQPFK